MNDYLESLSRADPRRDVSSGYFQSPTPHRTDGSGWFTPFTAPLALILDVNIPWDTSILPASSRGRSDRRHAYS